MRTAIIIFGITGDLSQRKLLPALYHLTSQKLLPDDTVIIGVTRQALTEEDIIDQTKLCVLERDGVCDLEALGVFKERLRMFQIDLIDIEGYRQLKSYLTCLDAEGDEPLNQLFYLSIPPQVFASVVKNLGESGLNQKTPSGGFSHLMVEKPFGYDRTSAQELINVVNDYFTESQVFRIDHYLAKETAQNILAFRFNNPIFEPLWSNEHIKDIRVSATEKIGIENRAIFYEQTGALRDLIQSHLLQLLSLVTMEKPASLDSNGIHDAKLALLNTILPADTLKAVRGQYSSYRHEVSNDHSATETFASLELAIDNDRWRNVPIYVETGKALDDKRTAITIRFADKATGQQTNTLAFALQPNEAITIDLRVKRPGLDYQLETASMDFEYRRSFTEHGYPDAYERVLMDALRGDQSLFASAKEVMATWNIVQPVMDMWADSPDGLIVYESGSSADSITNQRL